MAVYTEEKTNTWRVVYRFVDWTGEKKQTQRRGFKTRREAVAWEHEQLNKAKADLEMTLSSFVEQYEQDMKPRLKENTWEMKSNIIRSKILPYFGKLKMCNITAQQIRTWQNELINYRDENGQPYSPVYLKTIHNQISAIFNHAVRYYNLKDNPCVKAGSMGKKKNREMLFWTKEEYLQFADVMMDKPMLYYAFEMLYWCGIREGEMLALTPADFNFEKGTVTINKSYQRIKGDDKITSPKTEKSNRTITMPQFLVDEIKEYIGMIYKVEPDQRMAQLSYHIATGANLWKYPVHQGEVLYLALEDDFSRIQKRLYKMFGTEDTENLHFATQSMSLNGGLCQQLEEFITEHPNTQLIIVDTLQKVREAANDKFSYANDYEIVAKLKAFSDKHNLCLLVVHHTRKMEADDSFEMISGTNGLLGAADGAFILQKKKRTDATAILSIAGRDQQDQELQLKFDQEHCLWRLIKAETDVWKAPPDPILDAVAKLVTPLIPEWSGNATELLDRLSGIEMLPHHLSKHLNANTDRLFNDHGITYKNIRTHNGRVITLTLNQPSA